jgi:hypothetical protein
MTTLKDKILNVVKEKAKVHISTLINITSEDGDVICNDVIKEAIESLVSEGKIDAFPMSHPYRKGDTGYKMPEEFYRPPIEWGWESYLKLVDPWDGIEKKFSSGEWVYDTWRRGLGDKKRWVREPIPKDKRDGMEIRRQWMYNAFWRYILVAPDGSVYTLREEENNCD